MSGIEKNTNWRMVPFLLLIIMVFSTGCTDKDGKIEIDKGGDYSVVIPAEKGDVLYIKWETDGNIQWQLSDDNGTIIPGNPQDIVGFNNIGEENIKIQQNATFTLTFDNLDDRAIDIELEWEIR